MDFEFYSEKARRNKRKHGVSFADAEGVFFDHLAQHIQDPDLHEERFIAVGLDSAGQILVTVYTLREEAIRLISARQATLKEVRDYERRV